MIRGPSDDWLSCMIRRFEAVLEQHGFVEDTAPEIKPSEQDSITTWNKLLRRFNLLASDSRPA